MASLTRECEEYQGPVHYPNQRWIPLAWHRQNEPKDIVTWILYLYFHLCEYWTAFAFVFVFALALENLSTLRVRLSTVNFIQIVFAPNSKRSCVQNYFNLNMISKHCKFCMCDNSPDKWRMAKMWFWLTAKNIKSRPWLHPGTLRENSSLPESRQKALNWN